METAKKALIFDADGTLYSVKTAKAYSMLYKFLAKKTGLPEEEIGRRHRLEVARARLSKNPEKRNYLYSISRVAENAHTAKRAEAEFWKTVGVRAHTSAGTLRKLGGRYLLAIASDEFFDRLAKKMGMAFGADWKKYFTIVVTPDSTGEMKPSCRFYRTILKRLDVKPSEALMIGNSWENDLEPAARMGISTVLLGSKKKGKPDFFIRKISSLERILKKWK